MLVAPRGKGLDSLRVVPLDPVAGQFSQALVAAAGWDALASPPACRAEKCVLRPGPTTAASIQLIREPAFGTSGTSPNPIDRGTCDDRRGPHASRTHFTGTGSRECDASWPRITPCRIDPRPGPVQPSGSERSIPKTAQVGALGSRDRSKNAPGSRDPPSNPWRVA